jgi:hypothetical protein
MVEARRSALGLDKETRSIRKLTRSVVRGKFSSVRSCARSWAGFSRLSARAKAAGKPWGQYRLLWGIISRHLGQTSRTY